MYLSNRSRKKAYIQAILMFHSLCIALSLFLSFIEVKVSADTTSFAKNNAEFMNGLQKQLEQQTSFNNSKRNTSQSLKFLSYNIQLSGLDTPTHLWEDRKVAVSTLLSYADIIALQEITYSQLLYLKMELPSYDFIGFNTVTGRDLLELSSDKQEGLVIAFRRDVFILQSTEMLWYSDTPNVPSQRWGTWTSAFPKALQKATLAFKVNGKEIDIFNSHFAHDEDPGELINPRILSSLMELGLLKSCSHRYWISAGDRNFHEPRDTPAYELYTNSPFLCDSKASALTCWGNTTFMGYEDHPRANLLMPDGTFAKNYYLDILFHNSHLISSHWWTAHLGEYNEKLHLLPIGNCRQFSKRLFASDHAAIFVEYGLFDFWDFSE